MNLETAPVPTETDHEEFHIDCERAANWLLRRLANIESEKARITAQAAEMVRQLETDAERLRHLYEGELLDYCRRRMAQGGNRRRSVTFLQGSVCFRTVSASVRVADPFAARDYAQRFADGLVVTQVTVKQQEYQRLAVKHLADTGELLPGVETTPEHETHRLTFGGKE